MYSLKLVGQSLLVTLLSIVTIGAVVEHFPVSIDDFDFLIELVRTVQTTSLLYSILLGHRRPFCLYGFKRVIKSLLVSLLSIVTIYAFLGHLPESSAGFNFVIKVLFEDHQIVRNTHYIESFIGDVNDPKFIFFDQLLDL